MLLLPLLALMLPLLRVLRVLPLLLRVRSYESGRAFAGAHLMFNAFWMVSTFCIYQMYMRDSLHQVDHGVIIHILRAILRLFQGELTSTST